MNVTRAQTLQILVHGATYTGTSYWSFPFEPETYSYTRFAAAQGYPTLNYARLGMHTLVYTLFAWRAADDEQGRLVHRTLTP